MKEQYTVGEFSEMFGLNVQTLRYYDSIGLFQPRHRDSHSARRQYAFDQVYGLACVLFLRRMGYSLAEVQAYMNRREGSQALGFLSQHADALHRQLEDLQRTEEAIRRKVRFTQAALAELEEVGGTGAIYFREYQARRYIPIGQEETLYYDDSFYLYPTIAFYDGQEKIFGALLHEDAEMPVPEGVSTAEIEAGRYLCGYHVGPYDYVKETDERLRQAYPELCLAGRTIDFNLIDQFVERDNNRYITAMQIRVLGGLQPCR